MKPTRLSLSFSLLFGCTVAPPVDTAACLEICSSELELSLGEASGSFQIQIYGDEFNTLNLACPDEIRAGGPGQVEASCLEGGVFLLAENYLFPETLTVSVDLGAEQVLSPDWEEEETCGTVCNRALVEVSQ